MIPKETRYLFELFGEIAEKYQSLLDARHRVISQPMAARKAAKAVLFEGYEIVEQAHYQEVLDKAIQCGADGTPKVVIAITHNNQYARGGPDATVTHETFGEVEIEVRDYRIGSDCRKCGQFFLGKDLISISGQRHNAENYSNRVCTSCAETLFPVIADWMNGQAEQTK